MVGKALSHYRILEKIGSDPDFVEARLCDIVRSSAGESADVLVARIFDAIDRIAGTAPQFDDITALVLKKL